jgi:hypothetical protein
VETHEEIHPDFRGKTMKKYVVMEARTSDQQLSH